MTRPICLHGPRLGETRPVSAEERLATATEASPVACGLFCSDPWFVIADVTHTCAVQVPVVFGCETRETGEIFNQEADGILGLGNSPISLVNQARARSAALCSAASAASAL